jgi:hypothetical protein
MSMRCHHAEFHMASSNDSSLTITKEKCDSKFSCGHHSVCVHVTKKKFGEGLTDTFLPSNASFQT